jgi:glutamate synthase domain-containing protein 3
VSNDFKSKCNTGTVDLEAVEEDEDIVELREMIELHREYTGSTVAAQILDDWPSSLKDFVKVMPTDYKRVLAERKRHDEEMEQTLREDETGTFVAHGR